MPGGNVRLSLEKSPAFRPEKTLSPHAANRIKVMQSVLKYATTLAVVGVFLVLLAGFWNMMRGSNPSLSQKLMRWRVGLQFLAIMIAMILVYLLRP